MQEVFVQPVRAADGYAYEQSCISAWLKDHDTSPVTNLPMPGKRLQSMPDAVAFMRCLVAEAATPNMHPRALCARRLLLCKDTATCNLITCKQKTVQSKAFSERAIVTVIPSIHGLHRHHLAYTISQELT